MTNKNELLEKKEAGEGRAETVAGPNFESLKKLMETSPHVKKAMAELGVENIDVDSDLEEIHKLIVKELRKNPESKVARELADFKDKIGELLWESEEVSPARAHQLFENALINAVNDELEANDDKITSSDGPVSLKWLVDEDTPDGRFALIQRLDRVLPIKEDESGEMVSEGIDPKTGKEFWVRKMTGPVEPMEDAARVYDLKAKQVRAVFDGMEPSVKKVFINDLKERVDLNKTLIKEYRKQLKLEKRQEVKEALEAKISGEELAQEKLKKELQALA